MSLVSQARAIVRQRLDQAAADQLRDLEVLIKMLPTTYLPALVQEGLQTIRDAGAPELLAPAVREVDRFLRLAAKEVGAQVLSSSDIPGPKPSAYRIFRRLLAYRQAALAYRRLPSATVHLMGKPPTVNGTPPTIAYDLKQITVIPLNNENGGAK